MSRMWIDRRILLVALALAVAGCAAQTGGVQKAGPNEIALAVAGPMTGELAAFGEELRKGAQAAVDDINAKGGVLGKQLHLVIGDDQCDPKRAVGVANDMVRQGVVFVDGHFCSGSSIPASAVYAEEGILQMTPSSTNPYLTEDAAQRGIKTIFRVCNRDDWQGRFAGEWLAKVYTGKKLAVVDDESPYGRSVAEKVVATASGAGLAPALRQSFAQKSTDFSALLGQLKAQQIDVVYFGGYHNDLAHLVRQARDAGFKGDFVSDDALNTSEFWSMAGSAGEGVRFSDAASAMNLDSARAAVAKFRSDGYEPEGYTLNAYAAIQAFAAAATATSSTDGRKMADWLRANHVPTVVGDLAWDDKGDMTKLNYTWFIWHDGKYAQEP
jgi:branched-chain amino acid transport system substrate-binding protein